MTQPTAPPPQVRWVADPSSPTGGYFVDAQGQRLPPGPTLNPSTGAWDILTKPETGRRGPSLDELPAAVNRPGWKVVGEPVPATDADGAPILGPNGNPVLLVNLVTPDGLNRQMTVAAREGAAGTYDVIKGPADVPDVRTTEETNANIAKAQADTATAQAQSEIARNNLEKSRRDAEEAARNEAAGKGYLTNEQVVAQAKIAADQQLNADQVAVQRAAMENTNRNTIVQNQIAATNAATAAANAASSARANEAQIRHIETGDFLEEAKFAYLKSQDEIRQQNEVRDQTLKELQQAQTHEVQTRQNVLRGQELEQRKAEAAQTAATQQATAATSAAANVYGTERQAQTAAAQTGAGMLNQRVSAGQGMLSSALNLAGQRPLVGLAPGAGAALMSDIQGFATQLGGGQAIYDTAARLVQAADQQNGASPMAQQAYGMLTQIFARHQQEFNQPHPYVAATQAAQASATNGGMAVPQTQPVAPPVQPVAAVQPVAVVAPVGQPPIQQAPQPYQRSVNYNPFSGFTAPGVM